MIEGGKSQQNDDAEGNGKRGLGRIPAVYRRGAIIGLVTLAAVGVLRVAQSVVEPSSPIDCTVNSDLADMPITYAAPALA